MALQESLLPETESVHSPERKYQSPMLRPSSMTPPPSTQIPQLASALRTPTPTHSHLSSPPPTIKSTPRHSSSLPSLGMFSTDQIADATTDELRSMITEVAAAYREARTAAAHHSLQYTLLSMDSSETMKRMEVELEMTQKEVEVLQAAAQRPTPTLAQRETPSLSTDELLNTLRNHIEHLKSENESLRHRLKQAKALILERESVMTEESNRLRERISENRKHINLLRRSNGSQEGLQASALSLSPPFLGHMHHSTEVHPSQIPGSSKSRGDEAFAALLLADQVLSQEVGTGPSTPSRGSRKQQLSERRASHSMASAPSTPLQQRVLPASARIPSQPFSRARPHRQQPTIPQPPPTPSYRRQESRDSTISASDADDEERVIYSGADEPTEANQDRNTYSAPRKSMMRTPQTPKAQQTATPRTAGVVQTRLYGKITKPGVPRSEEPGKRKFREVEAVSGDHSSFKKGRMEEGVGLGIGGLTSPGR